MLIGIDASKKGRPNDLLSSSRKHYAFKSDTYGEYGYGKCSAGESGHYPRSAIMDDDWSSDDDDGGFKTGDQVTMEFDTKYKTLKYYKNGDKLNTWCQNIKFNQDTIYNMAVSMRYGIYCLELIDFKVLE